MTKYKQPAALIIALAVGAGMVGCGGRTDQNSTLPTSPSQASFASPTTDPYNNAQYPTPGTPPASPAATPRPVPSVAPATPDATPSAAPSGSPSASPSATPSASPSPSVPPISGDYRLRITDVKKTTSGFWLWKKAEITVQVQNPLLTRAQTGKIVVTYFHSGSIVGQPIMSGISLQPADIKTFTFKATEKSDDANAQVTTDGK
ncbi:MAG: hypothetical protein FJZ00_09855 [Candidatus Sericytochromatia bacterium]|uniref:Uncharacterized protein n=1 Tax=Candidatus Tanganyikabacteria bacterium TaxID=2961651 RepID=A0A938BNJ4_9BACT|nr:hypothetical protein [Candidatus Tanganyikabacteria bacterium]